MFYVRIFPCHIYLTVTGLKAKITKSVIRKQIFIQKAVPNTLTNTLTHSQTDFHSKSGAEYSDGNSRQTLVFE